MTPEKRNSVQFTRESADRIARVVRETEITPKPAKPLTFQPLLQSHGGKGLQLGTFTGNWNTAAFNVVTLAGTTATVSVLNVSNPVAFADCPRTVAFSVIQGTNVAVELQYRATCATCHISIQGFDLSSLPDYSGSTIQILGHDADGCLRWYPVFECT